MGEQESKKVKKRICVGLLAHVDAGKTTLSEAMLYLSGAIRKMGRVDYGNTFLDTEEMEKNRGITIFSKQAVLTLEDTQITLLDTPGHVDFSAEMERTLQVLDYGILIISAVDGVQGHTLTLWKLMSRYQIPVFLFINKMDQEGAEKSLVLRELQQRLDSACLDFSGELTGEEFWENLAVCDEELLNQYLENGRISDEDIRILIKNRKVFPCFFGSALKMDGVEDFLIKLKKYLIPQSAGKDFRARVFKISRDSQGNRLTHMKITGGCLRVKDSLTGGREEGRWEEKVNQIRIYSGAKFEAVSEAGSGTVCAVTGLTKTYAGEGLGEETEAELPVLEPVLCYQILFPKDCDVSSVLPKLQQLSEEEPLLHIAWKKEINEVHVQLMGEVQIDVLKDLIWERFGIKAEFGEGNIVYKETIQNSVEGIGHFEPLRHYAEVHLLLEPGERGSGIQCMTSCSEDVLDRNWQRLVLTHLEEQEHRGVLTGAAITDMQITLVTGRAHLKHTEGGDFRQAVYRALRQGLMKAKSLLLEPYYNFRLELPSEFVGRAMSDIQKMSGEFEPPQLNGEMAVLSGFAPVSEIRGYSSQLAAYSRGLGRLFCTMRGYEPCHNAAEVIEASGYCAESDLDYPADSVFCAHGAGFIVPWNQVESYMHVESGLVFKQEESKRKEFSEELPEQRKQKKSLDSFSGSDSVSSNSLASDKELDEIFRRTYGESKREKSFAEQKRMSRGSAANTALKERNWQNTEPLEEYLLVDGYNIIFSWEELKELSKISMDSARHCLMDILCNYQGFKACKLILVFDAYKVEGHPCEVETYHNIYVVYTKEAETADQYIEKTVHELGKKYKVTVATSDGLEQVIILGQGGLRLSAKELKEEIERTNQIIRKEYLEYMPKKSNLLFQQLDEESKAYVKEVQEEGREDETAKKKKR